LLAGGGALLIYLMSGESPEKRAGLHPSDTGERESREGRSPGFAQSKMPRRASVSDTGAAGGQVAQHGKERRQKVQAVVKRAKEKPVSVNRENRVRKNLPSPPPSQGGQQGEFAGKNTRNGSTVSEHRGLPELADPDLILQAISWDRDPGRRIAVINSRLCREGDVLGEYTVLTINPDDVSLVRGDTRGRLVFPGK
jgi:hypothetical protein